MLYCPLQQPRNKPPMAFSNFLKAITSSTPSTPKVNIDLFFITTFTDDFYG